MRKQKNGLKNDIRLLMTKNKTKLFSINDITDELKTDYKVTEQTVRQLRIDGELYRHIERDCEGNLQYAVSMHESKRELHKVQTRAKNNSNIQAKKRSKQLPSSKEIRSMFAQNITNLAKLEDMVMLVIVRHEEIEKELVKIKRVLGNIK